MFALKCLRQTTACFHVGGHVAHLQPDHPWRLRQGFDHSQGDDREQHGIHDQVAILTPAADPLQKFQQRI